MKVRRLNGNGNYYTLEGLKVCIKQKHFNDVARRVLEKESGLKFEKGLFGYFWATPKSAHQILKLITRWNYTSKYYNNATWHNILFLTPAFD